MPNKILLEMIGQRAASLLNAAETDIEHRKKWLTYLFETSRRNSRPSVRSHIPAFFTDEYARAAITFDALSLTASTCIQKTGDGRAYVLYTPRMHDYILSAFGKYGKSEFNLSEEIQDDSSVGYYLEVPREYIEKLAVLEFAINSENVLLSLNIVPPLKRIKFRIKPDLVENLKNSCWMELQAYEIIEDFEGIYSAIVVPKSGANDLLCILGSMGALPSKDEQIELFVKKAMSIDDFRGVCSSILSSAAIAIPEEPASPTDITCEQIIEALTRKLETLDLDDSSIEQRPFYYLMIRRLLVSLENHIEDGSLDVIVVKQRGLALSRIFILLQSIDSMSYKDFLIGIHLCLDDIMLMISIASTDRTLSSIREQIHLTLSQFVQRNCYGEPPTGVSLTDSGMQACHLALITAINEISAKRDIARVHISHDAYFEITLPTYSRKHDNKKTYRMNGKGEFEVHSDELIDIWCGGVETNVSFEETSHKYIDVSQIIKRQFELRAAASGDEDSPFIVILDNTMSSFSEVYLPLLLCEYEEERRAGKLVIIIAHSLNKFFNMGQDNTPAGLLYSFSKKEKFPILTAMHEHASRGLTAGLSPIGQTVHYISALMRHCPDLIDLFQSRIQDRSRILNETCIPKTLMDSEHPITIYIPRSSAKFSLDETSSECILDLSNYWNFITICIHINKYGLRVEHTINEALKKFFEAYHIYGRRGFGFSETTYDCFVKGCAWNPIVEIYRLSLGTESLSEQKACINALAKYLMLLNRLIESNLESQKRDGGTFLKARIKEIPIPPQTILASPVSFFSASDKLATALGVDKSDRIIASTSGM